MDTPNDRGRLLSLIRRLLDDVERHSNEYHHVTPPALIEEAQGILREALSHLESPMEEGPSDGKA